MNAIRALRRPARVGAAAFRGGRSTADWRRQMAQAGQRPYAMLRLAGWLASLLAAPPRLRVGPLFGRALDALAWPPARSAPAEPEVARQHAAGQAVRRRPPRKRATTAITGARNPANVRGEPGRGGRSRARRSPAPEGLRRARARLPCAGECPPEGIATGGVAAGERRPRRLPRGAPRALLSRLAGDPAAAPAAAPVAARPRRRSWVVQPPPTAAAVAPMNPAPDAATRRSWLRGLYERAGHAVQQASPGAGFRHSAARMVPWALPVTGERAPRALLEDRVVAANGPGLATEPTRGERQRRPSPGSAEPSSRRRPPPAGSAALTPPRKELFPETEEGAGSPPPWELTIAGERAPRALLKAWSVPAPEGPGADSASRSPAAKRASDFEPLSAPGSSAGARVEHRTDRRDRMAGPSSGEESPETVLRRNTATLLRRRLDARRPSNPPASGAAARVAPGVEPEGSIFETGPPAGSASETADEALIQGSSVTAATTDLRLPLWTEAADAAGRRGSHSGPAPLPEPDTESESDLTELGAKIRRILAEEARRHGINV